MIHNVYSIFDTASGCYQRPFYAIADGMATRAMKDLVIDREHPVGQHPEDYSLFRIGSFDDGKGLIITEPNGPQCLCTGLEVLAAAKAEIAAQNHLFDESGEPSNA